MCASNIQSISHTGRVKIVFSKPILPISSNSYEEIAASGVIQAQLFVEKEVDPANIHTAIRVFNFTFKIQEIT